MTLQEPIAAREAKPTCWGMWLKHKEEFCPFLPDLTSISPQIEFLQRLFAGDYSYIVKVRLQGKIYVLKMV